MLSTFTFVTFAWIFFRADNIESAFGYLKQMAVSIYFHSDQLVHFPSSVHVDDVSIRMAFIYIIPLIIIDWFLRRNERSLFKAIPINSLRPLFMWHWEY